jgi:hypothetical protein
MKRTDKRAALSAIKGLTFADCVRFFAGRSDRERHIVRLARERMMQDGELELDEPGIVSEGADNGAYVMAWVWLDFAGEPGLDKKPTVEA